MWVFTAAADWVDENARESNNILDQWVEGSNYDGLVMIAAAATHSIVEFGASTADVLRLGDGVKAGTLRGFAQDGLRFVAVFPVARAARMLRSATQLRAAKLIKDIAPNAGICSWVGTTKALRQTGHKLDGKLFAEVADLAKAAKISLKHIGGISLPNMVAILKSLGAKIGSVTPVVDIKDLLSKGLLKRDGSVVLISLRGLGNGKEIGGHLAYAYYDAFGRLRFMDRTIGSATQKAYKSLEELAKAYSAVGVDQFVPRAAVSLGNVFVKSVALDVPKLVLPIQAVIAEYKEPSAAKSAVRSGGHR